MGREGLEMLSLVGPSCFCSLPKMLPVHRTEQDDALSPLLVKWKLTIPRECERGIISNAGLKAGI